MNREQIAALEWAICEMGERGFLRDEIRHMDVLCRLRDAALSAPKAEAVEQIPQDNWDEAYKSGFNDGFGEAKLSSKAKESFLINEAITLIREDREDLFASHQVDGKLRIECDADRRSESHIANMDRWLEQAEQFLNGASITTSPVPTLTDEVVERVARAWASIDGKLVEFEDERKSGCSLIEEDTGTYERYMADASELLRRTGFLPVVTDEAVERAVELTYRNWRGKVSTRRLSPERIWYGSTEWHPEPQWLLRAYDREKQAHRDFALKDFGVPALTDDAVERMADWLSENFTEYSFRAGVSREVVRESGRAALLTAFPSKGEGE